jgi:hypothetical protein
MTGPTPGRVDLKAAARTADLPVMGGDRGDIVLGWLTKVVLTLAVLGVVGFDVVSLGLARVVAEDHAQDAARAAGAAFRESKDLQTAYDAAVAEALTHGDTVDASTFTISSDGRPTLTLRRTVPTLLVEKIGPLRSWADVASTVTAGAPA